MRHPDDPDWGKLLHILFRRTRRFEFAEQVAQVCHTGKEYIEKAWCSMTEKAARSEAMFDVAAESFSIVVDVCARNGRNKRFNFGRPKVT